MGEMATLVQATPGSRPVADVTTVPLLRRVVESLATMRPGRYTVYLGRPDPAAVRAEWDQEVTLLRSARRAVVTTPDTTPLPQEADRREPGLGWLAHIWFSAVRSVALSPPSRASWPGPTHNCSPSRDLRRIGAS